MVFATDISARVESSVELTASTSVYRQGFDVRFEYEVIFDRHIFRAESTTLLCALSRLEPNKRHRLGIVVEKQVAAAFPDLVERIVRYVSAHRQNLVLAGIEVVAGGESAKKEPASVEEIQKALLHWRIDRHSYLVAIGGGALLDVAGYAAATFHRGVRHVRIPTTVLAQNDSGVGVKNGVNAFQHKNLLGTFAPPFAVINDSSFLAALPPRERIAGMAEAVKVALIRDRVFFEWLERHASHLRRGDLDALEYMIRRCAELHMAQIAHGGDPFERGSARPLDFGHWVAHKLETLTEHTLRHGEAVALGIALDTRYAATTGLLALGAEDRVRQLLGRLGFSLWHDALEWPGENGELAILTGLEEFREHLGGELSITLLREIGVSHEVHHMEAAHVRAAVEWLRRGAHP